MAREDGTSGLPEWVPTVAGLVGLAALILLYNFDVASEHVMGTLVVGVLILLPIGYAWGEVVGRAPSKTVRVIALVLGLAWLAGAGVPLALVLFPGAPVGQAALTKAAPTTLDVSAPGPYELEASGEFRVQGSGDAQAGYGIKLTSSGGGDAFVHGSFDRKSAAVRVGRRGSGVSTTVHNENRHHVAGVGPGKLTLSLTNLSDLLVDSVQVSLRAAPPPVQPFFIVLAVVALGALVLDVRLTGEKARTHLAALVGLTGVFAWYYPQQASSHTLVRSAIGALITAAVTGGLGGLLFAWLGRALFVKTPPAKRK